MTDDRKSVLVTGCSKGGIGYSLAREFNAQGLRVFATARDASSISELTSLGIEPLNLTVDDPSSITALHNDISRLTAGRGLDFLVNNAGRNYTVAALDVDFDEVQQTFEVNLFGVMRMCQAFAPLLIQAKGTIVQIGSLAAVMPYVFGSAYNASKAALHAYSNTLRVELAPFDVKVVTIITGGVTSRITRTERSLPSGSIYMPLSQEYQRRLKHSQESAMPNEDYARSVVRQVMVRSPARHIWEGKQSYVAWFVTTFLPKRVMDYFFWRAFNMWKLVSSGEEKRKVL